MKFSNLKDIEKNAIKPGSFKHHLKRLEENGGRIVKGVNTTPDVGTDEIKKQAAKFGFKVDKDGRPSNHPKNIRGPKTNVAFNLGLTESKINEAKDLAQSSEIFVDMDGVLADFFGEWQKLIGKGWRDVEGDALQPALQAIRDKDDFWLSLPMTSNAKGLLNLIKDVKGSYNILSAPLAGDKKAEPHKREWIKKNLSFFPPKNVIITADKQKYATQPDGTPNILIDDFGSNISKWEGAGGVGFKHKDHKFERTAKNIKQYMQQPVEEGNLIPNPQRSTLVKADDVYQWYKLGTNMANIKSMAPNVAKRDKPDIFLQFYGGEKEKKYMMKQLKRLGYDVQDAEGNVDPHYDEDVNETYTLYVSNFFENFADGKKKGKSRPGRVKKAGASCNGSVTSLRKRAKASSGEKAKMYHWCANMKSGRKKK